MLEHFSTLPLRIKSSAPLAMARAIALDGAREREDRRRSANCNCHSNAVSSLVSSMANRNYYSVQQYSRVTSRVVLSDTVDRQTGQHKKISLDLSTDRRVRGQTNPIIVIMPLCYYTCSHLGPTYVASSICLISERACPLPFSLPCLCVNCLPFPTPQSIIIRRQDKAKLSSFLGCFWLCHCDRQKRVARQKLRWLTFINYFDIFVVGYITVYTKSYVP